MTSKLPVVDAAGNPVDAFICVRCAGHRKTCCQTSDVYATPGDQRRIAQFTGQDEFTEFRAPHDPVYLMQEDDPVWKDNVFRADGTRRVLKRQPNGDCTFLSECGCVLPLEVRPLICRIYPYDYTADGLRTELAPGCPSELIPPQHTLLSALDIKRSDAERWRSHLYEEVLTERASELT